MISLTSVNLFRGGHQLNSESVAAFPLQSAIIRRCSIPEIACMIILRGKLSYNKHRVACSLTESHIRLSLALRLCAWRDVV